MRNISKQSEIFRRFHGHIRTLPWLIGRTGACYMKLGILVRRGLFAALTVFAMLMSAALALSPVAAESQASIQVEGNRRVETETIQSYFKPGSGGAWIRRTSMAA
jgi:hypothetical protein